MDGLVNVFPSWEIEKKIGNGRYGAVYRAVCKKDEAEMRAAVKVIWFPLDFSQIKSLLSEGMSKEEVRAHLRKKAEKLVSELKNFSDLPNIVGVEDCKLVESEKDIGWDIYILMDMLTPLNKAFYSKKFTENDVAKLGVDICTALEVCRENNIVHGNIKPENIFVDKMDAFRLGDFALDQKIKDICESKPPVGAANYMAPEVAREKESDSISDIYSLGMVMYRLMNNNNLPFLSETSMVNANEREDAIGRRISGEPLPSPSEASGKMSDIILKACAFEPSDRFQSASEMKKALLEAYPDIVVTESSSKNDEKPLAFRDENDRKASSTNRHLKPVASVDENAKGGVGSTRSSLKRVGGASAADVRESITTNALKSNEVKQTVDKSENGAKPSVDTKNYSEAKPIESNQSEKAPENNSMFYGAPKTEDEVAKTEEKKKMLISLGAIVLLVAVALIAMFIFLGSSDGKKKDDNNSTPKQPSSSSEASDDMSEDLGSDITDESAVYPWDDPADDKSNDVESSAELSSEDVSEESSEGVSEESSEGVSEDFSEDISDDFSDDFSADDSSSGEFSDDSSIEDSSIEDSSADDSSADDSSSGESSDDSSADDSSSGESSDDSSIEDPSADNSYTDDSSTDDSSIEDSSADNSSTDDSSAGESSDDSSIEDPSADDSSTDDSLADNSSGGDSSGGVDASAGLLAATAVPILLGASIAFRKGKAYDEGDEASSDDDTV